MYRTRAFRRFQRRRAIHHKSLILRDYWQIHDAGFWNPTRIGALSKGKVHCSCWMCRRKSYDEPSLSDRRKAVSADQALLTCEEESEDEPFYTAEQADQETTKETL